MNGTTRSLAREPRWAIARNVLLAAIAVMSLLPQPWKGRLATFGPLHDCAHIAAFFLACLLTLRPGKHLRHAILAGAALWFFGIALEVLQTRFYHNRLEISDILDDLAGIALGVLIRTQFQA